MLHACIEQAIEDTHEDVGADPTCNSYLLAYIQKKPRIGPADGGIEILYTCIYGWKSGEFAHTCTPEKAIECMHQKKG